MTKIHKPQTPPKRPFGYWRGHEIGDRREKAGLLRYPNAAEGDVEEVEKLQRQIRRLKKQIIDFAAQF